MAKSSPRLSITIKFSIITAIVFIIFFELLIQLLLYSSQDDFKNNIKKNLVENAKLIASGIDSEMHKKAYMKNDSARFYYSLIQEKLNAAQNALNFQEEIFTVFPHPSSESLVCYGVMSNVDTIATDICEFRDSSLKNIFRTSFNENRPLYSDIYSDRDGVWVSGFAPIYDNNNKVVALVELDMNFDEYKQKIDNYKSMITNFRYIGLVMSVLFGLILGKVIGRPLVNVARSLNKAGNQEFDINLKSTSTFRIFSDEISDIISNFNEMSAQLKEVLSELKLAKNKLLKLDSAKSYFLGLLSHELKTPLIGINGNAKLINELSDDKDIKESAEDILKSESRLRKFADLSLLITRIQTDKYDTTFYEERIQEIMESAIKNLRDMANSKNIEIVKDLDTEDYIIKVDVSLISQVFQIVIENAIKFSAEGSRINISGKRDKDYFKLFIEDSGEGFSKKSLENLFQLFASTYDLMSHSEGTGLSLAAAKVIMEMHNFKINASNSEWGGAVVEMVF